MVQLLRRANPPQEYHMWQDIERTLYIICSLVRSRQITWLSLSPECSFINAHWNVRCSSPIRSLRHALCFRRYIFYSWVSKRQDYIVTDRKKETNSSSTNVLTFHVHYFSCMLTLPSQNWQVMQHYAWAIFRDHPLLCSVQEPAVFDVSNCRLLRHS